MACEVELKLALPTSARRAFLRHALLASAVSKKPVRQLFNIYFDTADLALRRRGIALRLRRIGPQWLQTVKCAGEEAGGLSSRPEWEGPYDGQAFDFSAVDMPEVRKFLEKVQRRGLLQPLFETDFKRRTWIFEREAGSRLILAYDEGEIRGGGRTLPLSELEIEIAQGGTDPLLHLAQDLAHALPVRLDARSKADRGYRLAMGSAVLPVHAIRGAFLTEVDTPRLAFRKLALAGLAHIQGNEEGVLGSDDPEFVHQMRVALRRLRSAIRAFAPVLPADFSHHFLVPMGELARKLGDARDWDVLLTEILQPVMAALPGDARLQLLAVHLEQEASKARQAARSAVADPAYGRLLLAFLTQLLITDFELSTQHETDLRTLAATSLREARRRLRRKAAEAMSMEMSALHAARIAAKRLRYTLEFLGGIGTERGVKKELDSLAAWQAELGHINDMGNARRLLLDQMVTQPAICEALALVEGWHRGQMAANLESLPKRLRVLAGHSRGRKDCATERA